MIHVAFVINSIHIGGPSYVIRNIIENMDHIRFKIYLITLFDAENTAEVIEELSNIGVEVIELHVKGRKEALISTQRIFNKVINNCTINVIHSHGFIPDILSARCKAKNITRITTIHNNLYTEYPEVYGRRKAKYLIPSHIFFLRKLDICACCSQFVYDSMHVALSNLAVVRNGIGNTVPKKAVSRADIGVPDDATLFIYVGQLRTRKNIIWLLQQFKNFHRENEYLIVLGKGADKEACEKIQDPNIIHYGFSDNPYAFMRISDVYISAALAEGFSISVLEAMDNGLALFLSDIPAHTEAFTAAKGVYIGECFKSNDSKSFEKQLNVLRERLSSIDKDAIRQIKDQEMSAEKMTKQYEELYTSH